MNDDNKSMITITLVSFDKSAFGKRWWQDGQFSCGGTVGTSTQGTEVIGKEFPRRTDEKAASISIISYGMVSLCQCFFSSI